MGWEAQRKRTERGRLVAGEERKDKQTIYNTEVTELDSVDVNF